MTQAASLQDAAYLSYQECATRWVADTLPANVQAFVDEASPIFPEATAVNRTVGNWLVLIQYYVTLMERFEDQFPALNVPQELLNSVADAIYRMCLACLVNQEFGITPTQDTALLAAWNANIGTP